MHTGFALLLAMLLPTQADSVRGPASDTLRLEVGSPEVDGRSFPAHRARNRVYPPGATEPSVSWTNELTLGDSAGRPVMRWVTRGGPVGTATGQTWELRQTYDARTLAPLAYSRTSSNGGYAHLRMEGRRVRGVQRLPTGAETAVDVQLDRPGFIASASDLIPVAVGLRAGAVMIAPVWGPNMTASEERVFTVLEQETVTVEGSEVLAWKVDEHVAATGRKVATWWLTEASPYMVLAEVVLPNGQVQRITGVALDEE